MVKIDHITSQSNNSHNNRFQTVKESPPVKNKRSPEVSSSRYAKKEKKKKSSNKKVYYLNNLKCDFFFGDVVRLKNTKKKIEKFECLDNF